MKKFCQFSMVCLGLFMIGCGPSKPAPISEEKLKELNAKMGEDMKSMTLPRTPGK